MALRSAANRSRSLSSTCPCRPPISSSAGPTAADSQQLQGVELRVLALAQAVFCARPAEVHSSQCHLLPLNIFLHEMQMNSRYAGRVYFQSILRVRAL
eukprot:264867-Pyramimonas_sp.AAC.1